MLSDSSWPFTQWCCDQLVHYSTQLEKFVRQAGQAHLGFFYLSGFYYHISKRLTGLRYILLQSSRAGASVNYRVLGKLILAQLFIRSGIGFFAALYCSLALLLSKMDNFKAWVFLVGIGSLAIWAWRLWTRRRAPPRFVSESPVAQQSPDTPEQPPSLQCPLCLWLVEQENKFLFLLVLAFRLFRSYVPKPYTFLKQ